MGKEPGGPGCQGWPCGSFRGGEKAMDSRLRLSPTVVIGEPAGMTEGRGCGKDRRRPVGIQGNGQGVRGRSGWAWGAASAFGERRKDPGFPLTTGGNDRREETGGKDGGVRREGRGGADGKDRGCPTGRTRGCRREGRRGAAGRTKGGGGSDRRRLAGRTEGPAGVTEGPGGNRKLPLPLRERVGVRGGGDGPRENGEGRLDRGRS